MLAQNGIRVETHLFNGSRFIVQRMLRKVGREISFGAIAKIHGQNIKRIILRV